MKLLWISPYAPYDTVGHGGGQNHNYYLKYIKKNTDFDITLVSVCETEEASRLDMDKYGIDAIVEVCDRIQLSTKIQNLFGKIWWFRDSGLLEKSKYVLLKSAISKYVARGETPDVIITQWTEATLLYDELKRLFPTSKYVAIEEDVAYQGYKRKYERAKGMYRIFKKLKYQNLKRKEIHVLEQYDLVVALNKKDENMLCADGISSNKILRICSYFNRFKNASYCPNVNQILYYGAMGRKENNDSVMWFIEHVMPKLENINLIVVGSHPSVELQTIANSRVEVLGFVDDVKPYFENSLCLIAPLTMGGGIKIKVLEALSAGLPVLTNDIGAEGIGIDPNIHYLHCESAKDYIDAISRLRNDAVMRSNLSNNSKKYIDDNFNTDKGLQCLIECLKFA